MNIEIHNETADDIEQIHRVTERAFQNTPHADHTEQFIIDDLRRSGALTISLVAKSDGKIIGHVAISPVVISDGTTGWFGLGPVSVLPEHQGRGVGTLLVNSALETLKAMAASGCVVLGEPSYYRRFGFEAIKGLIFPGVPAEYFQALSFSGRFPEGEVTYHDAFYRQG